MNDENKQTEFNKNINYKKIANISQQLMESKRCSEDVIDKLNDNSSTSSGKDNSSRENSKSPMTLKSIDRQGKVFDNIHPYITCNSFCSVKR